MDSVSLLPVLAILFVLWLAVVALSTSNCGMTRHVHRNHGHLGR